MFYKSSHPGVLAAWDQYACDCNRLTAEGRHLEAVLGYGARCVHRFSVSERWFEGVQFKGGEQPFSRELWTIPRACTGWSCRPRQSRIPKNLRPLADALAALWAAHYPKSRASFAPVLEAMGLDFTVVVFGSFGRFRTDDVAYIETALTPNDRMVKISSYEYLAAREALRNRP